MTNTNIDKSYIYDKLNKISINENIDIAPYVEMMLGSDEIPYEVVVFVNKHIPIEKFTTYNEIYKKRNNSNLFRNLVRKNITVEEKAIVLSSLLTQTLISLKHSNSNKEDLIDALNVSLLMNTLSSYLYDNDSDAVNNLYDMFQIIFKTLFPKN